MFYRRHSIVLSLVCESSSSIHSILSIHYREIWRDIQANEKRLEWITLCSAVGTSSRLHANISIYLSRTCDRGWSLSKPHDGFRVKPRYRYRRNCKLRDVRVPEILRSRLWKKRSDKETMVKCIITLKCKWEYDTPNVLNLWEKIKWWACDSFLK